MEPYFNSQYIKQLYLESKNYDSYESLGDAALNKIEYLCKLAATNHQYSIDVNLREEYCLQRTEYFSRDEYAMFCSMLSNSLKDRGFSIDYNTSNSQSYIMTISWY